MSPLEKKFKHTSSNVYLYTCPYPRICPGLLRYRSCQKFLKVLTTHLIFFHDWDDPIEVKSMLLYYMDVSQLDINKARSYVSKDRVKKSDKFRYQKDKKLSIGVEILLNYALSKIGIFNPLFGTDKYDKPFLKNHSDVHFNLSHSEKYVACAVSDSPVGVDIEYIHDIDLNIAKNYFFGTEYEHIMNNKDRKRIFFQLWVLKESYMKMTGLGFRLALDEFAIQIDDEINLIGQENEYEWGLWNISGGEYILGVCSKSKVCEPELISLQDIWGFDDGSETEI